MALLAAIIAAPLSALRWRGPPSLPLMAAVSFLGWAVITALWSPAHTIQAARLILTLIGGAGCVLAARGLTEGGRAILRRVAPGACALLIALIAIEALFRAPVNRFFHPESLDWVLNKNPAKGAAILLCLIGPVMAWRLTKDARGYALTAALVAATAWASLQFDDTANAVAFTFGAIMFAVGYALSGAAIRIGGALVALWALLSPWLLRFAPFEDTLPYSWAVRLHVWRFAAERVAEKPWFGWGLDASRTFPQTIKVQDRIEAAIPLHPHNVFAQVWLETGAIGAVLLATAIVLSAWAGARHATRAGAAGVMAAAGAIFVIDNFSFGVWQEWWLASCFLPAILLAAQPKPAI